MEKIIETVRKWFAGGKTKRAQSGGIGLMGAQQVKGTRKGSFKSLQIQPTPNPEAYQFFTNQTVISEGSIQFGSKEEAEADPFAEALFHLFGIESVFLKDNFVTVTKSPVVGWNGLIPKIEEIIETQLTVYDPPPAKKEAYSSQNLAEFTPDDFMHFPEQQKEKIINAIFDYAIRPALANDGGDLSLIGIKDNVIQIHYQGACGTCPSSTRGTLQYIQNMIQENLHPDLKVEVL